jgi:hypothetical protein
MSSMPHTSRPGGEPTVADLAAIEAEWPLISAELDVLDAEITILSTKRPTALDWRRLRRAEAGLIRAFLDTHPTAHTTPTTTEEPAGGVAA